MKILAYDCEVKEDEMRLSSSVPVVLFEPRLMEMREEVVAWYRMNKRQLPWREHVNAYRVWVSEIMLQQTRVEAVKPYYERFLKEFPTVKELAEAEEDKLLKLWEGLGYYNRVKNMQKAAKQVMIEYNGEFPDTYEEIRSLTGIGNYTAGAISAFAYGIPEPEAEEDKLLKLWEGLGYYNRVKNMQKAAKQVMIEYNGEFPDTYEEIRSLTGIGNYTAGAISAFAYGIPEPAVDGNVLRVISRILSSDEDIMKASVRTKIENAIREVIPIDAAGDFNQKIS